MRQLNVLLSVLISVALAVFVMEIGLRVAGFGFPETLNHFDPDTGWSKNPGAKVHSKTRDYDVVLEINQLGLRDDPMASPAKTEDNVFRVLFLGDSFTLGSTVDREDLFVDQLEGWWNAENRRVDVINAGTEGYSTDQEVVWLLENGDAFQPDLVLLFPYENDVYWDGQTEYFGKPKPRFAPSGGALEARALVEPPRRRGGSTPRCTASSPRSPAAPTLAPPSTSSPPKGARAPSSRSGARCCPRRRASSPTPSRAPAAPSRR